MGKTPFKLKGWSPFTKTSPAKDEHPEISEEVFVDPDKIVRSNVLQDIDARISAHKKNQKETKPWADQLKALQAERNAEMSRIKTERAG